MKKIILITILLNLCNCVFNQELFEENFVSSSVVVNGKIYPYYIVLENNQPTSIFIESVYWTDKIYGYGGPINLQIYYTLDGKIKKIKVLEHSETQNYASKVLSEDHLKQYYNKNSTDKFVLGEDIKSVTGATITASALNEIIYQATQNVNRYIFNKQNFKKATKIYSKELLKTVVLFLIYTVSIVTFLLNASQVVRYAILVLNIVFLGMIYSGGLSFSHILNIKNFFTTSSNIFIIVLIILSLLTTIIFGRLYCGWLCPFGAVSEILFEIKRFFERKYKKTLGKEIELEFVEDTKLIKHLRNFEKYFRYIKYIFATCVFVFPMLIIFEPFQYLFNPYKMTLLKFLYLIIILIFCLLFIRVWCRYLCPLGALFAVISKLSIFRLKINEENCLGCEICQNVCPTNAIVVKNKKRIILTTECILCNKCRQQCGPKNIIQTNYFLKK